MKSHFRLMVEQVEKFEDYNKRKKNRTKTKLTLEFEEQNKFLIKSLFGIIDSLFKHKSKCQ